MSPDDAAADARNGRWPRRQKMARYLWHANTLEVNISADAADPNIVDVTEIAKILCFCGDDDLDKMCCGVLNNFRSLRGIPEKHDEAMHAYTMFQMYAHILACRRHRVGSPHNLDEGIPYGE
jgi:hypothetical protein